MVAAQEGDRHSYEALLTRIASVVQAFVRKRVGDASWCDDVVQESLLAVHRARHTYDPGRPFAPWLYAIIHHRFIDALRVQRRRLMREVQVDAPRDDGAAPPQEREALLRDVRRAVSGLPDNQRVVIELLKFEDLSVREVAARLRMTETNVKVTAHRGYRALRRQIEEWTRAD